MVRATRVAVPTASNSGTINDLSRPVSSIISTTVEMGPCVVAAKTAAAPSTANSQALYLTAGAAKLFPYENALDGGNHSVALAE